MLGVVTVDDVIDVIQEEQTEDVAEVRRHGSARRAVHEDRLCWTMIRKRGGWLAVLFVGEMLTATVMEHYEGELGNALIAGAVHPADHQLGRQLRFAGDVADHSRHGAGRSARCATGGASRCASCLAGLIARAAAG